MEILSKGHSRLREQDSSEAGVNFCSINKQGQNGWRSLIQGGLKWSLRIRRRELGRSSWVFLFFLITRERYWNVFKRLCGENVLTCGNVLYLDRRLGDIDVCFCQNSCSGTLKTYTFHYIFKRPKRKQRKTVNQYWSSDKDMYAGLCLKFTFKWIKKYNG